MAAAFQFEKLVGEIFKINGFTAISDNDQENVLRAREADFIFRKGEDTFIVEVKFYRTARSQIQILHRACDQLFGYLEFSNLANKKGILVISSILANEAKKVLQENTVLKS